MTEEVKNDQVVETPEVSETQAQEVAQPSQAEVTAREQGWVSKEEWVAAGKDAGKWRTAEHYVDRGELIRSLSEQKAYTQRLRGTLEELKGHHARVYERAHQDALTQLKAAHQQAVQEGEAERAALIVDKITEEKDRFSQERARIAQVQTEAPVTPPEVAAWKTKNQWYDTDEDMRTFADAIALKYAQSVVKDQGRAPTPQEVLKHLDDKIAAKFPKQNPRPQAAPNPVQSGGAAPARQKTGGLTEADLTPNERKSMNDFIEWGVFKTKADYIKELEKTR